MPLEPGIAGRPDKGSNLSTFKLKKTVWGMGTLCTNLDLHHIEMWMSKYHGFFPRSKPDLFPEVGDTLGPNIYVLSSATKAPHSS